VERLCTGGENADGMPIVFSKELDPTTVQPGDIQIRQASGKRGKVFCTTFLPAIDPGELRTVLLIGEFGTSPNDEPVEVTIVGNIYDAQRKSNFLGQKVVVTPLSAGPFLVRAEVVPKEQWKVGAQDLKKMGGSGCPADTKKAVRAIWSGGVTKPGGAPADDKEGGLYQVFFRKSSGESQIVTPTLADLQDGDNNHLLCLKEDGTPKEVFFPKGYLTDPNEDAKNPATKVLVFALQQ